MIFNIKKLKKNSNNLHQKQLYKLLEQFGRISLYVTDDAIEKLYVT